MWCQNKKHRKTLSVFPSHSILHACCLLWYVLETWVYDAQVDRPWAKQSWKCLNIQWYWPSVSTRLVHCSLVSGLWSISFCVALPKPTYKTFWISLKSAWKCWICQCHSAQQDRSHWQEVWGVLEGLPEQHQPKCRGHQYSWGQGTFYTLNYRYMYIYIYINIMSSFVLYLSYKCEINALLHWHCQLIVNLWKKTISIRSDRWSCELLLQCCEQLLLWCANEWTDWEERNILQCKDTTVLG